MATVVSRDVPLTRIPCHATDAGSTRDASVRSRPAGSSTSFSDGTRKCSQADPTVTFFFTDHGEYLGDYGLVEKWPSGVDEMLLRNPLIVHDPTGACGVEGAFVELVDLTATLEDFAGIERDVHFGRSFQELIADPSAEHRDAAFSEGGFPLREEPWLETGDEGHYRHKQAIQHERTELVGRAIAVRTADWCYVERLYEGAELYDRRA